MEMNVGRRQNPHEREAVLHSSKYKYEWLKTPHCYIFNHSSTPPIYGRSLIGDKHDWSSIWKLLFSLFHWCKWSLCFHSQHILQWRDYIGSVCHGYGDGCQGAYIHGSSSCCDALPWPIRAWNFLGILLSSHRKRLTNLVGTRRAWQRHAADRSSYIVFTDWAA